MQAQLIEDRRLWNEFVASAPSGHICQTYEWPEHVSTVARQGSLRIGVLDEGCLVAAMVLVRGRTGSIRAPFYYAPCGPVCADPRSPALPLLLAFARREAAARHAFMIRVEPNVSGEAADQWMRTLNKLGLRRTSHSLYPRSSWVTDLRQSDEELLTGMHKTWRYGIRAASRRGLSVRRGTSEADLDAFYRMLVETGRRANFFVYPRDLYRDMLSEYSEARAARDGTAQMELFLVEYQGVPVAAATVAVHGTRAWYMHGASASLPDYRRLDAVRPLLWECIQWARRHGAEEFDWRTIPDSPTPGREMYGVYAFKRGFGGVARQSVPTYDMILRPAIYWPYIAMVSLRRWLRNLRSARPAMRETSGSDRRAPQAGGDVPASPVRDSARGGGRPAAS